MKIADVFFGAELDDSKLQIDAKKSGDKAGASMGAQISTSLSKTAFVGFAATAGQKAFNLLEGAVGGVTDRLGEFVDKARENEVMSTRLDAALKANVVGWDGNRAAIDAYIESQTKLGFQDNETTASLAQLVAATGDVAEAQKYQAAAMDLARLKGVSLAEATDALTKVEGGSYRILKSLGIELRAGATQTEALAAVQKVAAGQANAFAKTSAGSMEIFNAKLDQVEEKIGQKLIPVINLMADNLSAALDVLDNDKHADSLVGQTKDFVALGLSVDTYKKALDGVTEQYNTLGSTAGHTQQQLDDLMAVMILLQAATKAPAGEFVTLGRAQDDLTVSASLVAKALDASGEAAYYAGVKADVATPQVHAFFDRYSIAASKGDIAQDTLDIMANAKAVSDAQAAVEKATPGTEAYRKAQLELTVAQGQLAKAHERLTDDQITLFNTKPDKKTAAALDKYFKSLGTSVNDLTGDAKLAYLAVNKMLHPFQGDNSIAVTFTLSTGKGGPQKLAAGGWVGLNGPELIMVGDGGGPEYVISNDKLGQYPDMNASRVPSNGGSGEMPTTAGVAPGGNTYVVNAQGLVRARTASEIGDNLRRLADFGVLTPREAV